MSLLSRARMIPASAWQLSAFYLAMFSVTGASMPYLSLWLSHRTLTGAEIGAILSGAMFARTICSPLLAVWAEGFADRRAAILRLAAAAAAVYCAYPLAHGFWGYFLITTVGGALFSAMFPLIELLTLNRAQHERFAFGLPRGIGSAAFLAGNLGMGALLSITAPTAVVVWIMISAWGTALLAFVLPAERIDAPRVPYLRRAQQALDSILGDRVILLTILAGSLIQAAHAFNYSFSALVWKGQGISSPVIGTLWAAAIVAEILVLAYSERLVRLFGPRGLIILGGVGALVRWIGLSTAPGVGVSLLLQTLHMFSFTATHLGVIHTIRDRSPAHVASVAQTLNSAISGGVLLGVMTVLSGHLYEAMGARGYLAMAVVAGTGTVLALSIRRWNGRHPQSAGVGGDTQAPS